MPDGKNIIKVRAYDLMNNYLEKKINITIKSPPTISDLKPFKNVVYSGENLSLSFKAYDNLNISESVINLSGINSGAYNISYDAAKDIYFFNLSNSLKSFDYFITLKDSYGNKFISNKYMVNVVSKDLIIVNQSKLSLNDSDKQLIIPQGFSIAQIDINTNKSRAINFSYSTKDSTYYFNNSLNISQKALNMSVKIEADTNMIFSGKKLFNLPHLADVSVEGTQIDKAISIGNDQKITFSKPVLLKIL